MTTGITNNNKNYQIRSEKVSYKIMTLRYEGKKTCQEIYEILKDRLIKHGYQSIELRMVIDKFQLRYLEWSRITQ